MALLVPIWTVRQEITAKGTPGLPAERINFEPASKYGNHHVNINREILVPCIVSNRLEFLRVIHRGQPAADFIENGGVWSSLIELFGILIQQRVKPIRFGSRSG